MGRSGREALHLVDLNGAFAGKPKNEDAIRAIIEEVGSDIPVQLGGGIRDLNTIERYLDVRNEIDRSEGKLANPGFVQKAPPELVQQEREKLERYRRELDDLER